MKKFLTALLCMIAAVLIVVFLPGLSGVDSPKKIDQSGKVGLFDQQAERILTSPEVIHPLYEKGELIGIVRDENRLMRHMKQVYRTRYQQDYPDSAVYLADDMYMTSE